MSTRQEFLLSSAAFFAALGLAPETALAAQMPSTLLAYGPAAMTISRAVGLNAVAWLVHRDGEGIVLTPFDPAVPGYPVAHDDMSNLPRLREITRGISVTSQEGGFSVHAIG